MLGALSVEPMTGYRLRAAITDTLGHFWHESFGQIYPTLKALEADGLVEREGATRSGAFRITARGTARLHELLAEPFTLPPARDPLLLRLFFGRHVDPELTRERITQALDAAVARSEEFARVRAEIEGQPDAADGVYWLLTLSAGEHAARARIAWAREALELLDRSADGESRPGSESRERSHRDPGRSSSRPPGARSVPSHAGDNTSR